MTGPLAREVLDVGIETAADAAAVRTDRDACVAIAALGEALRALGRPAPEVSWFLPMPNFDYVGEAMLALFQISTNTSCTASSARSVSLMTLRTTDQTRAP